MCEVDERFPPVTCGAFCDSCSFQDVFRIYTAENITAAQLKTPDGLPVYLNSTGGWAACRGCVKLVEAAQWDELLERCFDTFKASQPPFVHLSAQEEEELKGILRGAHEEFRQMQQSAV
ncbi:MAG TPA: hypothetical protein VG028_18285 [Terriglobia bacterium]|nr:hypothetical protein [Terriglobia bacterium]